MSKSKSMRRALLSISICSIILLFSNCKNDTITLEKSLDVVWKIDSVSLDPSLTHITQTIKNNSGNALTADNWSIDYNHIGGRVQTSSMPADITIKNLKGDYFRLAPTSSFASLTPGASKTFKYAVTGFLDKMSETPAGIFAVIDGSPEQVNLTVEGVNDDTMDPIGPTTAATRFVKNNRLSILPKDDLLPFIPSPSSYQYLDESKVIGKIVSVTSSEELKNELNFLKDGLSKLGISIKETEDNADITLALERSNDGAEESYLMRIDNDAIAIVATAASGVYYGVNSLLQYISYASMEQDDDQLTLRGIDVTDKPRFDYRGMHLDVARNFHTKETVMKVIDAMAYFKLNKFHFHLTDDEGWRLEIPGLPELTNIGGRRGYTEDESDMLLPAYGSGPHVDDSYGSGYYTKADFIDILRYADERHIEVISEVDVPAHARAAIVSMRARYNRLMADGDEEGALYYRLDDPDDQSEYGSAQNWSDNVICICQDGAYNFMEKVFSELVEMYKTAGVPLTTLHIGNDELPYGAWQKSPICDDFIKKIATVRSSDDLPGYFAERMAEITKRYDLVTGGWEEMAIVHNKDAHDATQINLSLLENNIRLYVWNAIIGGGRDDMIYKLANAGFPVVMSNSSSFYFDMAYDRDPDEIGLSWSGYADMEKAYSTEPMNIFFGSPTKGNGDPLSKDYLESRERINNTGRKNFLGIQAQLWSETVHDAEKLEYLIFPKLLGFAERAWSAPGKWTNEITTNQITSVYNNEWNVFANTTGQKTLPLLDQFYNSGIQYRIPEPGAVISNNTLIANSAFPGLKIEYQIGNSGPTKVYDGPVTLQPNDQVYLWSIDQNGRTGRKTTAKISEETIAN